MVFRGLGGTFPWLAPVSEPPTGISALFEHSQGTKIRKNDIQKLVRRFVGFVNHQAGVFAAQQIEKGHFSVLLMLRLPHRRWGVAVTKKGTHLFIQFAE